MTRTTEVKWKFFFYPNQHDQYQRLCTGTTSHFHSVYVYIPIKNEEGKSRMTYGRQVIPMLMALNKMNEIRITERLMKMITFKI